MVKPRKAAKQDFKSLRGILMVDSVRGRMRARVWPRKRGKPKAAVTLAWNQWFKDAARLSKFIDPKLTIAAMEQTKNTGLYPRDVIFQAMSVGVGDIVLPDGQLYQHGPRVRFKIMYQGAIIRPTANISIGSGSVVFVPWPLPVLDTLGFWSSGSPTRLTIPAGVQIVRFFGGANSTTSNNGRTTMQVRLNGSAVKGFTNVDAPGTSGAEVETGPVVVSEGDYAELGVFFETATVLNSIGATYFGVDVLQMIP